MCVNWGFKMGKIKQWVAESKARKQLGQEKYYALRQEFLNVFNSICSSLAIDNEGKGIVEELRALREDMWKENLFKVLGTAMVAVSVWRYDCYTLRETIAGLATGVIMATIAQVRSSHTHNYYNDKKDELIDYVARKTNDINASQSSALLNDEVMTNNNVRVAYKDACDDLTY